MPSYFTGDTVTLEVRAAIDSSAWSIASATVDVWNPAGTKVVTAAAMTVTASRATYQVPGSATTSTGTYRVEYTVQFGESQGQLSMQQTFSVVARYS